MSTCPSHQLPDGAPWYGVDVGVSVCPGGLLLPGEPPQVTCGQGSGIPAHLPSGWELPLLWPQLSLKTQSDAYLQMFPGPEGIIHRAQRQCPSRRTHVGASDAGPICSRGGLTWRRCECRMEEPAFTVSMWAGVEGARLAPMETPQGVCLP